MSSLQPVRSSPDLARLGLRPLDLALPNRQLISQRRRVLAWPVASYPFRKDVDPRNGTVKLLDFPQMVVDRFQVKGIEPLDQHFPSTDVAYLESFRKVLASTGTHVVNIPVGQLHGSFFATRTTRSVTWPSATARHWVDVAKITLGSPGIRVHVRRWSERCAAGRPLGLRQPARSG